MAINTTIGNGGFGSIATDVTVKDMEMAVSNMVKDKTVFVNMAQSKTKKIDNWTKQWSLDTYRKPAAQARVEGANVSTNDIQANNRGGLGNFTQIFTVTTGNTGTARAVVQAGGDPQEYEQMKQLVQIYFDVEAQLVRNDQFGTKYAAQSGSAIAGQLGRRFGSLASYAGTVSFNTTGGTAATMNSLANNPNTDVTTSTAGLIVPSDGSTYYSGTFTTQGFAPVIYQQLVTTAESRYDAKVSTVVSPTSLRTMLSAQWPTSRSINRVDSSKTDSITRYEGDFGYSYQIGDSWVMDNTTSSINSTIYFVNPDVIEWGSLRDLGPNTQVVSNADASLAHFVMEGTLIVRNPAGVATLNNISSGAAPATTARDSSLVQRTNTGFLNTY